MKNRAWKTVVLLLVAAMARIGSANTPEMANGGVRYHWNFANGGVQYHLATETPGTNIDTSSGRTPGATIDAAFATWNNAPNVGLVPFTQGAAVDKSNVGDANPSNTTNVICFTCNPTDSSANNNYTFNCTSSGTSSSTTTSTGGDDTLAITETYVDEAGGVNQGVLVKADILFSPCQSFTTDPNGPAPGSTANDLQTVATHEVGHFLGLDHSGILAAVMYPYAPSHVITLSYDDVAGMSQTYPKSQPDVPTGSMSGAVTLAGAGPVFGAHVFAESTTGALAFGSKDCGSLPAGTALANCVRKSPVGGLTDANGNYTIAGLPADTYQVTAEPLDGPVSNGNFPNYAPIYGKSAVQTNFTTRWH